MQNRKNRNIIRLLALLFILLNFNFLTAQTKDEKKDFKEIRIIIKKRIILKFTRVHIIILKSILQVIIPQMLIFFWH